MRRNLSSNLSFSDDFFFQTEQATPVSQSVQIAIPTDSVELSDSVELCSPTPEASPASSKKPQMSKGDWSEKAWITQQASENPLSIVVYRVKNTLRVRPTSLLSAGLLTSYSLLLRATNHLALNKWEKDGFKPLEYKETTAFPEFKKHAELTFPLKTFLESESIESSAAGEKLQEVGLSLIVPPSTKNWFSRARRQYLVENTSIEMPNVKDDRELIERLEPGLLLKCKTSHGEFHADYNYVVMGTGNEQNSAEENVVDGCVRMVRMNASWYDKPHVWSPADGSMDDYFEMVTDSADIYNPEDCFPAKFPKLFEQNTKKLQRNKKLWDNIYLHVRQDAAQGASYRNLYLGNPMRLGKTSESIAITEIYGSKKVGIISPTNGRQVFYDELVRLGFDPDEIVVVRNEQDLYKPGRWFLMTYNWLKSGKDNKNKSGPYETGVYAQAYEECPHCKTRLVRPICTTQEVFAIGKTVKVNKLLWTEEWGYLCRNKACTHIVVQNTKTLNGTAWKGKDFVAKGYVDFARAGFAHTWNQMKAKKTKAEKDALYNELIKPVKWRGRQEVHTGWVKETWIPPKRKRVRKLFSTLIVDEAHYVKGGMNTAQAAAVLNLRAKHHLILTGTLMPNEPGDAYYPLMWAFRPNSYQFPYDRDSEGKKTFNGEYTESVIVKTSDKTNYKKSAAYLKKPIQFWKFMAPKMIRRQYNDPLVVESFKEAGLIMPSWTIEPLQIQPSPAQLRLIVNSIEEFEKNYAEYKKEIKTKSAVGDKNYLLNSSMVLSQMVYLRMAATCPGLIFEKKNVFNSIDTNIAMTMGDLKYTGEPGGCKMPIVRQIVQEKVNEGGKVLILSDFRYMQKLLEEELFLYDPIRFQTEWSEEERAQAFLKFQKQEKNKVFIAGPRAVKEAVDLSRANTCICTDLLWTPGMQQQAWSRILTPRSNSRHCQIVLLVTKYSVDHHVYGTFYSKMNAAEQALDRKIVSKSEKSIDIQYFVDQILNEKTAIQQYLLEAGDEDMLEMPILSTALTVEADL